MFLDLHMIQSFAPGNLNRDDTGAPKDCQFGGHRRARISSQCLKRAIRTEFRGDPLVPLERRGERTKRLIDALADGLSDRGRDTETARAVARVAVTGALGLDVGDDDKTEYLLFLGNDEIAGLADRIDSTWDDLAALVEPGAKRKKKDKLDKQLLAAFAGALAGGRAVDVALFGRMLADRPGDNVDAACQVAHALSTHRVAMEVDFYTAVDDRNLKDDTGAGMMGVVEFNSACYYRYASIDLGQLAVNLGGDVDLAADALAAFLRASVAAIPTGKQNSFAAHNPPAFVMADLRTGSQWSLANAFESPVVARGGDGLLAASIDRLGEHYAAIVKMYGAPRVSADASTWFVSMGDDPIDGLNGLATRVDSVADLFRETAASVDFSLAA